MERSIIGCAGKHKKITGKSSLLNEWIITPGVSPWKMADGPRLEELLLNTKEVREKIQNDPDLKNQRVKLWQPFLKMIRKELALNNAETVAIAIMNITAMNNGHLRVHNESRFSYTEEFLYKTSQTWFNKTTESGSLPTDQETAAFPVRLLPGEEEARQYAERFTEGVVQKQPDYSRILLPDRDKMQDRRTVLRANEYPNITHIYGDLMKETHLWGNDNLNEIYTFYGDSFVEAGRGDDRISGGTGNDRYRHYGPDDGHDSMHDAGGDRDYVQFIKTSNKALRVQRVNDDLLFSIEEKGTQRPLLTVKDHFSQSGENKIEFCCWTMTVTRSGVLLCT